MEDKKLETETPITGRRAALKVIGGSALAVSISDLAGDEKPLVIEITEREFLGDIRNVRNILAPLIDFGLTIAIDDFGSGYSSFQYLADHV